MPPKHSAEGLAAAGCSSGTSETAVVVPSAHVEVEHAVDLLANGYRTGYLLKSRITDIAEIVGALKRAGPGGSAVDPALGQEPGRELTGRLLLAAMSTEPTAGTLVKCRCGA
jgi:serine/threonine-protein kinase PknK